MIMNITYCLIGNCMRICLATNMISISYSTVVYPVLLLLLYLYSFSQQSSTQNTPSTRSSVGAKLFCTPVVMKRATKNPLTHIYAHFNALTWFSSVRLVCIPTYLCECDNNSSNNGIPTWVDLKCISLSHNLFICHRKSPSSKRQEASGKRQAATRPLVNTSQQ